MDVVYGGIQHDRGPPVPSWLSKNSLPLFLIDTGDNSAGNGGNGHFAGSLVADSDAAFQPLNAAVAGAHAAANADQSNTVQLDQSASQIAGVGGDGGNVNAAAGGDVSIAGLRHGSDHGWIAPDVIATGGNSAGNGGDGYFSGSLGHAPVAAYNPINIAAAGAHATASADQSNAVHLDQSATQVAGAGGDGGNGNAATGGDLSIFGLGHGAGHGWIGSDVIATGANSAGNGGSGHFYGSLIDIDIAIYAPINIAVAGYNSSADADQTNNVYFDQSTTQIAGVGGDGGDGNLALGGNVGVLYSDFGLVGSDVIATGGNSAGNGGSGYFIGSLIDIDVAIYAPINIAVAGYNSTADADQINNVYFDQSTIQVAGVGGDGGDGNLALGGDFALHLLADHHLLDHVG